jgi:hypothetical protein
MLGEPDCPGCSIGTIWKAFDWRAKRREKATELHGVSVITVTCFYEMRIVLRLGSYVSSAAFPLHFVSDR